MPKRVRPYGSAEDAELAALGRGQPGADTEIVSDWAGAVTMRDVAGQAAEAVRALKELTSAGGGLASVEAAREVITSLERLGQDLPPLCEQLARILVVQREEGQIAPVPGQDLDFWVVEAVEALAAAGQAADMMTAALAQAGRTSGELRPARLPRATGKGLAAAIRLNDVILPGPAVIPAAVGYLYRQGGGR
jgi:hypothetical protein